MSGNSFALVALALLAALSAWLFTRGLRAGRAWVRIPGAIVAGLLTVAFGASIGLVLMGDQKLAAQHGNAITQVAVAGTPEQIARGRQLAWACADCHASNKELPLGGGTENFLAGGPPVGSVYATNLTPGGPLKDWTDGEIVRAIREGIGPDGRTPLVTPSQAYRHLSDDDAHAVVAYLRSQPAVTNPQPRRRSNLLASVLLGAGLFPTSAQAPTGVVSSPPAGPHAEYGGYLVAVGGCADCHGAKLDGTRPNPAVPRSPALRPLAIGLSEEQFRAIFRDGVGADGLPESAGMPWKNLGKSMSDDDLRAMQAYLRDLPE
jgi:mono/diheme cytochrome c family protein